MTNPKFISFRDSIANINESTTAKMEKNDCVVRTFASAFEIDYDSAHKIVKTEFKREFGKGTYRFHTGMDDLASKNREINGKKIISIKYEHNTMLYYVTVKGKKTLRNTTTSYFIKNNPVGTFIVVVRGHAFTIKDGVIIGNPSDAKRMKKHIYGAWKIE